MNHTYRLPGENKNTYSSCLECQESLKPPLRKQNSQVVGCKMDHFGAIKTSSSLLVLCICVDTSRIVSRMHLPSPRPVLQPVLMFRSAATFGTKSLPAAAKELASPKPRKKYPTQKQYGKQREFACSKTRFVVCRGTCRV